MSQLHLIDTDIHNSLGERAELLPFLPRVWHEPYRKGTGGGIYASPIGVMREDARPPSGKAPGSDPAFLLEHHFDAYNVDFGILTGASMLGLSLHPDADYANALASAYNQWTAEKWLPFSSRFRGSIYINHSDAPAAAREIERWAAHPGMVQVIMASASRDLFGQRRFHPIYAAAQRHNLPVAIHPGNEGAGVSGAPTPSGYPSRYMEWHNILPANYMGHINSLVCEGIFEKFPGLKFVAIEGGLAWIPHLMWRMDKNYKALRSTTPWLKKLPSQYIREHIRLTTQPIEEPDNSEHMLQILEMMDAKNTVMFSSDYPHWDFDNPKMALPPIGGELKEHILWRNAAELYGLGGLGKRGVGGAA